MHISAYIDQKMSDSTLSLEVNSLHADICSAIADPWRILLIYTLNEKPYTVNELANQLELSQPATSRHLKVLRERGLVQSTRQGNSVEYSLIDTRLIEALELLRHVLRDRIARRLEYFNLEEPA